VRPLVRALVALALVLPPVPAATALCGARPSPVGTEGCGGVRPGAALHSGTETCTFGFLLQGSDNSRYVMTAGHCAVSPDPARDPGWVKTWPLNAGPVVTDADGKKVGRFAYATMSGQFKDFALIRIDKSVPSYPRMCHFGGPVRLTTLVSNDDVQVHHYGVGIGVGDVLPARTGDAFFGLYRPDYVYFYGAVSEGDSGSPVIDASGEAVGIVTDRTTPFTGNAGVNRLADHIAAASKALKVKLTLLVAPLIP